MTFIIPKLQHMKAGFKGESMELKNKQD